MRTVNENLEGLKEKVAENTQGFHRDYETNVERPSCFYEYGTNYGISFAGYSSEAGSSFIESLGL